MNVRKLYPCEICDYKVAIRSTIKSGEHKDKKACPRCKNRYEVKAIPEHLKGNLITPAQAFETKGGYSRFFRIAIEVLKKNPICQNCGGRINEGYEPVRNIAHILPKQRYKSVAIHPSNYLFLCSGKDHRNGCHEKFDDGFSNMLEMPCFELVKEKFKLFQDDVTENGKLFRILADSINETN